MILCFWTRQNVDFQYGWHSHFCLYDEHQSHQRLHNLKPQELLLIRLLFPKWKTLHSHLKDYQFDRMRYQRPILVIAPVTAVEWPGNDDIDRECKILSCHQNDHHWGNDRNMFCHQVFPIWLNDSGYYREAFLDPEPCNPDLPWRLHYQARYLQVELFPHDGL